MASSSTSAPSEVVVHPLVLLSVADHAARAGVKDSKRRVVGILLGQDSGKSVNVSNSFAVPFEEDSSDPKTFFLDHDYIENMYSMFRKVSARERIVGFYHSGPKLRASDLQINEVIKQFCAKPIMVIIHTSKTAGIPTDAYLAVEEIKDDGTVAQKTFMHIPSTIGAEEAEEIGVEHLLRDIKDLDTGTLSSRVAEQLSSLRGLQSRLAEIREYLQQVVKGELPVNHQIIGNLQDVFNLLPHLETPLSGPSDEATRTSAGVTITTNDQLLVLYLSSLIRAVIALHDLVNNKLELSAASDAVRSAPATADEATPAKKKEEDGKASEAKEQDKRGL